MAQNILRRADQFFFRKAAGFDEIGIGVIDVALEIRHRNDREAIADRELDIDDRRIEAHGRLLALRALVHGTDGRAHGIKVGTGVWDAVNDLPPRPTKLTNQFVILELWLFFSITRAGVPHRFENRRANRFDSLARSRAAD